MDINLDNYKEYGTPEQIELGDNWRIAIGLQQTDLLNVSDYFISLVNRNLNGELTLAEVRQLIDDHYDKKKVNEK